MKYIAKQWFCAENMAKVFNTGSEIRKDEYDRLTIIEKTYVDKVENHVSFLSDINKRTSSSYTPDSDSPIISNTRVIDNSDTWNGDNNTSRFDYGGGEFGGGGADGEF